MKAIGLVYPGTPLVYSGTPARKIAGNFNKRAGRPRCTRVHRAYTGAVPPGFVSRHCCITRVLVIVMDTMLIVNMMIMPMAIFAKNFMSRIVAILTICVLVAAGFHDVNYLLS